MHAQTFQYGAASLLLHSSEFSQQLMYLMLPAGTTGFQQSDFLSGPQNSIPVAHSVSAWLVMLHIKNLQWTCMIYVSNCHLITLFDSFLTISQLLAQDLTCTLLARISFSMFPLDIIQHNCLYTNSVLPISPWWLETLFSSV